MIGHTREQFIHCRHNFKLFLSGVMFLLKGHTWAWDGPPVVDTAVRYPEGTQ